MKNKVEGWVKDI